MNSNFIEPFDPDNPFEDDPETPEPLEDLSDDQAEEAPTEFDKAIFEDSKIDQIIRDYRNSQQNYLHLRKIFNINKKDL